MEGQCLGGGGGCRLLTLILVYFTIILFGPIQNRVVAYSCIAG